MSATPCDDTPPVSLYAEAMSIASEGMIITNTDSVILDVNNAFCELSGYTKKQLIGNKPALLSSGYHDKHFFTQLWKTIHRSGTWTGTIWDRKPSGEIFPQHLTIKAIKNTLGKTTHYIGLMRDISEIASMKKLAFEDALTGLCNRRAFEQHIKHELSHARRQKNKLALLYIDLDKFKNVNDSCGHRIGDKLLIEVAKRLKQTIRDEDIVARIGGDEFIIIIPQIHSQNDINIITRKINHAISQPVVIDQHIITIGCSIGHSIYPEHSRSISKLISHADTAMYHAKHSSTSLVSNVRTRLPA